MVNNNNHQIIYSLTIHFTLASNYFSDNELLKLDFDQHLLLNILFHFMIRIFYEPTQIY